MWHLSDLRTLTKDVMLQHHTPKKVLEGLLEAALRRCLRVGIAGAIREGTSFFGAEMYSRHLET